MTTLALTYLPLADSWNMHGDWGWGWMAPMMLGMALFWGAIILGFVWLVRHTAGPTQHQPEERALTVLDRRFAEGTVSADDYYQRKSVLTGASPPRPKEGARSPAIEGL